MIMKKCLILALVGVIFSSCNKDSNNTDKLFNELSPGESGISFANIVTESDSLNYFTYGYIYMGGGVAAGDFNNDGTTDIVIGNYGQLNELLLNNGDETFTLSTLPGEQESDTDSVDIADINDDGFLDIIFHNVRSEKNEILWNNGDNTFSATDLPGGE